MDRSLWKVEQYREFLVARQRLLAEAANHFLEEVLNGPPPVQQVDYATVLSMPSAALAAENGAEKAEVKRGRHSVVKAELEAGTGVLRSGHFADAIKDNDELVTQVVHEAADYLAYGLASIINFYNPQKIILGGGVIEAMDLIFDRATQRAREIALPPPGHTVEFAKAALGDNSGMVGAATLAGVTGS